MWLSLHLDRMTRPSSRCHVDIGRESSWRAIRSGGQAARWLNIEDSPVRWAGAPAPDALEFQISDFTPQISEPVVSLALVAAKEAILDAGLQPAADNDQRS